MKRASAVDWLATRPIAHRGLHDHRRGVPENSLLAFRRAVEAAYPIELDVRLLRDGHVAVFHDDVLGRMTGEPGTIADQAETDLADLHLLDTPQTIPLLGDVLALVSGQVPLLIEIKSGGNRVGALEEGVLAHLRRYAGSVAVQSFNPHSLRWFRVRAPQIPRGQLTSDFRDGSLPAYRKILLRNLLLNRFSGPAVIGYDIRCLPHWRRAGLRRKGLVILGWTVRDPEEEAWARRFCDNIIFEGYTPETRGSGTPR